MREFSSFEKEIIENIIEIDNKKGSLNVLENILEDVFLPHVYIQFTPKKDCLLKIENKYFEKLSSNYGPIGIASLLKDITEKLILIVSLIDYLSNNSYLILYDDINFDHIGNRIVDLDYIEHPIKDRDLKISLHLLNRKKFKPTEMLHSYVKNGYKTTEQLKKELEEEKQQLKIIRNQKFTIIMTIIIALGNILPVIVDYIKLVDNKPQKIDLVNDKLFIESNCNYINESNNPITSIYFRYNDYNLTEFSKNKLNNLVLYLNKFPKEKIWIIGHTDYLGNSIYNDSLSIKRAKSVSNYLTKNNINKQRINIFGYGENNPINTIKGEEESIGINRRADIYVK